jgi:NAD(P)-dependent dehydrogenase (short-subunit alcohol dehydrogenase family)
VRPFHSLIVIGAGPGIGRAVAARFADEGAAITLIARTAATVESVAGSLPKGALTADEAGLRAALDQASAELGPPDVVVHAPLLPASPTIPTTSPSTTGGWAREVRHG